MSDKINFHPYTVPQEFIVIHLMVFTKKQKHRLVIVLRLAVLDQVFGVVIKISCLCRRLISFTQESAISSYKMKGREQLNSLLPSSTKPGCCFPLPGALTILPMAARTDETNQDAFEESGASLCLI